MLKFIVLKTKTKLNFTTYKQTAFVFQLVARQKLFQTRQITFAAIFLTRDSSTSYFFIRHKSKNKKLFY